MNNNDYIYKMISLSDGVFESKNCENVNVSAFSIASCELTKQAWNAVREWSIEQGYDFAEGSGSTDLKPVGNITWYDAIKFCNALSEMYGCTPVYYIDNTHKQIYKFGIVNINNEAVSWQANGFRLPTEIEWEYACRAGTASKYYWGDVTPGNSQNGYAWVENRVEGDVCTHEVGMLTPNAFGLYDMSGNVCEWCWDWYSENNSEYEDCFKGPSTGIWRVLRGGSVALDSDVSSSGRQYTYPSYQMFETGLRIASSNIHSKSIEKIINNKANSEKLYVPSPQFENTNADNFCKRLFSLVNLETQGLEICKEYLEAGQWETALTAYRDFYFDKIKNMGEQPAPTLFVGASKDTLIDRAVEKAMSLKGRFPWFETMEERDLEIRKTDINTLVIKWKETQDIIYLEQWFRITELFVKYHKADFDDLSPEELNLPNHISVPQSWSRSMDFNDYMFSVNWHNGYLDVINYVISILPKESYSIIPTHLLAKLLSYCIITELSMIIKDDRRLIGNQLIHQATTIMTFGKYLYEFKDAKAWINEGGSLFKRSSVISYLSDGGDLEQAFGYNVIFPLSVIKVKKILHPIQPEWLNEIYLLAVNRMRMIYSLLQPFGALPTTGTGSSFYPPDAYKDKAYYDYFKKLNNRLYKEDIELYPDEILARIGDNLFGDKSLPEPAFKSIAFPYCGYYAMRDGWDNFDKYLFMISSRLGTGHANENINGISVIAYGRHLLLSAGAYSYNCLAFVPQDQHQYINKIDKYRCESYSDNTVSVDGYSQKRLIKGDNTGVSPYNKPLEKRWYTSDKFDFSEGEYKDGYGNKEITIDVTHQRQVFFVKQAGFWIILDKMISDSPHKYIQTWGFPGVFPQDTYASVYSYHLNKDLDSDEKHSEYISNGFENDEVVYSKDEKRIWTEDNDSANVFMHHFGQENLEYEKYYGSLDPTFGWQAPVITGRRYPKVDIHTSWQGDAGVSNLITLIAPSKDENNSIESIVDIGKDSIEGFDAMLNDGTMAIFQVSDTKQVLKAVGVEASAETFLITVKKDGYVSGVVLGCDKFSIGLKEIDIKFNDFEFEVLNGILRILGEIKAPLNFGWSEKENGICPSYE